MVFFFKQASLPVGAFFVVIRQVPALQRGPARVEILQEGDLFLLKASYQELLIINWES